MTVRKAIFQIVDVTHWSVGGPSMRIQDEKAANILFDWLKSGGLECELSGPHSEDDLPEYWKITLKK